VGILSACSTTYIFKYMGLDTLIVRIAFFLLLLNIWVWFISDSKKEKIPVGDFVEANKMELIK